MRELVSALVDGEVSDADLELAFAAVLDPDGQRAWALYHQIGDAVRGARAAGLSDGFAARLAAQLDGEGAQGAVAAKSEPEVAAPPATAMPRPTH